jgi:uncharacterized protein YndB with AHSA1/START domain
MPTESLELSWKLPVPPAELYRAWLDGEAHGRFTGSTAKVEPTVGGHFSAWDGYIHGSTLELEPDRRIVQSWRTAEFPEGSSDSRIELRLEPVEEGTQLTLIHTEIPEGQADMYRKGWDEFYVIPMGNYVRALKNPVAAAAEETPVKQEAPPPEAAPKKAAPKKAAAKKVAIKKAPAKKAPAQKAAAKKAPAKKAVAKKAAAKKAPAKKAPAKKAPAKKAPAKKAPAKKAAAKKAGARRR